jgi:hypothetical protein
MSTPEVGARLFEQRGYGRAVAEIAAEADRVSPAGAQGRQSGVGLIPAGAVVHDDPGAFACQSYDDRAPMLRRARSRSPTFREAARASQQRWGWGYACHGDSVGRLASASQDPVRP